MKRLSIGDKCITAIVYMFLMVIGIICLFPFVNVFSKSISLERFVASGQVFLLPKGFQLDAYNFILKNRFFFLSFRNSVIVVTLGVALNMSLTVLAGYPLSRKAFPGQKVIMYLFIFTMFFSGGMVPLYLLLFNLKLLDTLASLILPSFLSVYNLILMKNFFLSIPDELEESARMEGCSNFGILLKIFVPLSMPAIMTLTLFYAVNHWNAFFQRDDVYY